MVIVRIDTTKIRDWASFHEVFSEAFGFPDFYGRNMDAWIDCMTSLDDPAAGMSRIMPRKAVWSRSNSTESTASLNGVPSSTSGR
jgi:RNAse (barnase) inhibitor barstar